MILQMVLGLMLIKLSHHMSTVLGTRYDPWGCLNHYFRGTYHFSKDLESTTPQNSEVVWSYNSANLMKVLAIVLLIKKLFLKLFVLLNIFRQNISHHSAIFLKTVPIIPQLFKKGTLKKWHVPVAPTTINPGRCLSSPPPPPR